MIIKSKTGKCCRISQFNFQYKNKKNCALKISAKIRSSLIIYKIDSVKINQFLVKRY